MHYIDASPVDLAEILNIDINKLDYSLESLEIIDNSVNNYVCDEYFVKLISLPLISYVGKVFIKRTGGNWKFEIYNKGPYMRGYIAKDNKIIDFIPYLFREFEIQAKMGDFSSYAIVQGMSMF